MSPPLLISTALLGYLTGALAVVVALAVVATLVLVGMGLRAVGGDERSHLAEVARGLTDVRAATASLPGLLATLNSDLSRLERATVDLERHLKGASERFQPHHADAPRSAQERR